VGSLTAGKKKYAAVEAEITALNEKAARLEGELLALVKKDAEAFEPLAKAYGLPKETEAERAEKERVMEICLRDACEVPLEIMRKCCEAVSLCAAYAEKGSRLALSDAGVGAAFARAALAGASLNVYINTKAMTDRDWAARVNAEADGMLARCGPLADKVFADVKAALAA